MKRAAFLIVVGVALLFAFYGTHLFLDLRGWLGITTNPNGSSYDAYQALSGLIPALAVVSIFGGIITAVRQRNCHQKGCWRLAHHTTKKGYKLCKVHIGMDEGALDLHEIHPSHQ